MFLLRVVGSDMKTKECDACLPVGWELKADNKNKKLRVGEWSKKKEIDHLNQKQSE